MAKILVYYSVLFCLLLCFFSCAEAEKQREEKKIEGKLKLGAEEVKKDLEFTKIKLEEEVSLKKFNSATLSDVVPIVFLEELGQKTPQIPDAYIEPSLHVYFQDFLQAARAHNVNLSKDKVDSLKVIKYVDKLSQDTQESAFAVCYRNIYVEKTIIGGKKKKTRWGVIEVLKDKSQELTGGNKYLMEKVLFHEMYHCFLDKGHLPDDMLGIMNSEFEDNDQLEKRWTGLVDDLFSKKFMELTPDLPGG